MSLSRSTCPFSTQTTTSLLRASLSIQTTTPSTSPSPSSTQCLRLRHQHQQTRHATFIPRPRRPYTFTQLVTLTDGSTYLHRTSSPIPVYKSTKDTRNTQLWNPSSQRLMNVEADEAGRLRAFRSRFGRGWDTKRGREIEVDKDGVEVGEEGGEVVEIAAPGEKVEVEGGREDGSVVVDGKVRTDGVRKEVPNEEESEEDNLLDLISSPEYDSGITLGPKEKKIRKRKGKK